MPKARVRVEKAILCSDISYLLKRNKTKENK